MTQHLVPATEAEWSVLETLWSKRPATVRDLVAALYPRAGPSEYATVHKLLDQGDFGYTALGNHDALIANT